MSKEQNENINWYDIWMKQSKNFYETSEKNLKELFANNTQMNPEEQMKLIQHWSDTLKNQWSHIQLNEQQKAYETYWKMINKMCLEANDRLVQKWMENIKENNPIKNTHDLYALWLDCCNEVYKKFMHSDAYQEAYGNMFNAAIDFWKKAFYK